jgi:SAM-dependent methyltransferase
MRAPDAIEVPAVAADRQGRRPERPLAATGLARLHQVLERPRIYAAAWRALAPGAHAALLARVRFELAALLPEPGLLLDVGCGPRSWLQRAGLCPVGVDTSVASAHAMRRGGGLPVVARAEVLPFRDGAFASVWSFGLLHHLSDGPARCALAEATRTTRAGGRTVVFDGVLPPAAAWRLLARAIRRLDRGRHHRAEEDLRALLPGEGWRASRFTYAWSGLEGLWCVRDRR